MIIIKGRNTTEAEFRARVLEALDGFEGLVEVEIRKPRRTSKQNRAMHLLFRFIAQALNENNLFLSRELLKSEYEAAWTGEMVKELIWRPVQKRLTGKKSTRDITTEELQKILEAVQMALSKIGLYVSMPSAESLREGLISWYFTLDKGE